MNQLQRDLRRRIADKLQQWVSDSFDLYDMAEISQREAMSDILSVLLWHTATGLQYADVPKDEVASFIQNAMEAQS